MFKPLEKARRHFISSQSQETFNQALLDGRIDDARRIYRYIDGRIPHICNWINYQSKFVLQAKPSIIAHHIHATKYDENEHFDIAYNKTKDAFFFTPKAVTELQSDPETLAVLSRNDDLITSYESPIDQIAEKATNTFLQGIKAQLEGDHYLARTTHIESLLTCLKDQTAETPADHHSIVIFNLLQLANMQLQSGHQHESSHILCFAIAYYQHNQQAFGDKQQQQFAQAFEAEIELHTEHKLLIRKLLSLAFPALIATVTSSQTHDKAEEAIILAAYTALRASSSHALTDALANHFGHTEIVAPFFAHIDDYTHIIHALPGQLANTLKGTKAFPPQQRVETAFLNVNTCIAHLLEDVVLKHALSLTTTEHGAISCPFALLATGSLAREYSMLPYDQAQLILLLPDDMSAFTSSIVQETTKLNTLKDNCNMLFADIFCNGSTHMRPTLKLLTVSELVALATDVESPNAFTYQHATAIKDTLKARALLTLFQHQVKQKLAAKPQTAHFQAISKGNTLYTQAIDKAFEGFPNIAEEETPIDLRHDVLENFTHAIIALTRFHNIKTEPQWHACDYLAALQRDDVINEDQLSALQNTYYHLQIVCGELQSEKKTAAVMICPNDARVEKSLVLVQTFILAAVKHTHQPVPETQFSSVLEPLYAMATQHGNLSSSTSYSPSISPKSDSDDDDLAAGWYKLGGS